MLILKQIAYYLLFYLVGRIVSFYTPIPTGIAGICIGLLLLSFGLIKVGDIDLFGNFILSISGFILLPLFVEGWEYKELLLPIFWQWLLIILISSSLTLISTAFTIQFIQNLLLRRNIEKKNKGNTTKI